MVYVYPPFVSIIVIVELLYLIYQETPALPL